MKKDIIQTVIGICALIGIVLGALSYFAKADDLQLVEMRLENKIVGDQIYQLKQRAWQLEDRNGSTDCSKWINQRDKNEYREIKMKIEELQIRQQRLMRRSR